MDRPNVAAADVTDVTGIQSVQDGARIKQIVGHSESLTTPWGLDGGKKGQARWPIRSTTGRCRGRRLGRPGGKTRKSEYLPSDRLSGFPAPSSKEAEQLTQDSDVACREDAEPYHQKVSSPAKAGDPVRRGSSAQLQASLEYWITRMRG